jgi:hypothetical protein
MFVTYQPRKDSTRQDCAGSTVSLIKKLNDHSFLVRGFNHDGIEVEWVADYCELSGDFEV